jgi:MoaA/NifB/PqqE/SkfB family radical SAM enzyme
MSHRYPSSIAIETVNYCNGRCIFCPLFQGEDQMDRTRRPKSTMTSELFGKIVGEISAWPQKPSAIFLNMDGEPLLDRLLAERLKMLREKGLSGYVSLQTNAEHMNETACRLMIESGIACVTIGFDGATKDVYEMHRKGCSYDKVLENIRTLVRVRSEAKGNTKIAIQYVRTKLNVHEVGRAYEMFCRLLDPSRDCFYDTISRRWGGSCEEYRDVIFESEISDAYTVPCPSVEEQLVILVDGTVAACCWDYNLAVWDRPLGDVTRSSLEEIWNGNEFARLREVMGDDAAAGPERCCGCIKRHPRIRPLLDDALIINKELVQVSPEGAYTYLLQ